MPIDATNRTIFQLLQSSLLSLHANETGELKFPQDTNWRVVYEEMMEQAVAPISSEQILQTKSVPSDVKEQWIEMTYWQVGAWTKLMTAQKALLDLMNQNDIEVAIIKGSAAGFLYPHPEYRMTGDVDVIVKKEKYEKACRLMLENGYVFEHGEALGEMHLHEEKFHHTEFEKDGVSFEIHRGLLKMQTDEINGYVQNLIDEGLNHLEVKKIEEYKFPVFSKDINGLILLRHIVQHLEERGTGIGLRHILDWMMFADKYLDNEYWEKEFAKIVADAGLEMTAIVFTRMCQIYLGLREDNIAWCSHADEKLCEAWMKAIMQMGNFGRKQKATHYGVNVFYRNKNIFSFLKSLQKMGLEHWGLVHKYPVLRPFAWIYQIGKYVKAWFKTGYSLKSFRKSRNISREKRDLIQSLKIKGL